MEANKLNIKKIYIQITRFQKMGRSVGRWETKHFMGMALQSLFFVRDSRVLSGRTLGDRAFSPAVSRDGHATLWEFDSVLYSSSKHFFCRNLLRHDPWALFFKQRSFLLKFTMPWFLYKCQISNKLVRCWHYMLIFKIRIKTPIYL